MMYQRTYVGQLSEEEEAIQTLTIWRIIILTEDKNIHEL